jgi:hypothetical protein
MKKIQTLIAALLLTTGAAFAQSVGINSDGSPPASSAMLDISSTAKGFLAPRMTAVQRAAIISPATGLMVYQTDGTAGYYYNSGTPASPFWTQVGTASGSTQWTTSESNIYYNIGNIGIGTNAPAEKLHVDGNIKLNSYNKGDGFGIFFRDGESLGLNMAITAHDWGSSHESSDGLLISAWDGIGFMFGSNTFDVSKVAMMVSNTGTVGIGTTTPDASAIMEVNSNSKGFLPPRMTSAQRVAIVSPVAGLLVYQTDGSLGLYQYNGSAWSILNSSSPTYTTGLNTDLGGYVFFVTPDGKHGLVAETQDQTTSINWYNAQAIVSDPANHSTAGKNFTDWRMPTIYELGLMYNSRVAITGFSYTSNYWSGSFYNSVNANFRFFGNGQQSYADMLTDCAARAVRSF